MPPVHDLWHPVPADVESVGVAVASDGVAWARRVILRRPAHGNGRGALRAGEKCNGKQQDRNDRLHESSNVIHSLGNLDLPGMQA